MKNTAPRYAIFLAMAFGLDSPVFSKTHGGDPNHGPASFDAHGGLRAVLQGRYYTFGAALPSLSAQRAPGADPNQAPPVARGPDAAPAAPVPRPPDGHAGKPDPNVAVIVSPVPQAPAWMLAALGLAGVAAGSARHTRAPRQKA